MDSSMVRATRHAAAWPTTTVDLDAHGANRGIASRTSGSARRRGRRVASSSPGLMVGMTLTLWRRRPLMSLRPQPMMPVPDVTIRVARAAFPQGKPSLTLRAALGTIFRAADVAALFPLEGQPGLPPWPWARVTILPVRDNLTARQAAEAVRGRMDGTYLLGLEFTALGGDCSVWSECRDRLRDSHAQALWLATRLERCRA